MFVCGGGGGGGEEERGVGGSECLNVCVRVAVVLL